MQSTHYRNNTASKMGNCCGQQRTDDDVIPPLGDPEPTRIWIYVKLSGGTEWRPMLNEIIQV